MNTMTVSGGKKMAWGRNGGHEREREREREREFVQLRKKKGRSRFNVLFQY